MNSGSSDIFAWDGQFETGIPELDRQHRHLVDLVNTLARILSSETESIEKSIRAVLDELFEYVAYHFRYEEGLMHPLEKSLHIFSHKQAHAAFEKRIEEARFDGAEIPVETSGKLLAFLSEWLISHILGTDMRLAKALRTSEPGSLPDETGKSDSDGVLLHAMNRLCENMASRTSELMDAKSRLRREIDSHKLTEFELQKFSRAVEHSPVSILITDKKGRFEYVNPKFTRLTGYALHELDGKTPSILKSGLVPDAVYESLWKTVSAGGEWRGEFHNRKRNGELYWDHASISPIFDPGGRITHFVAIQEDITERKLAEEQLKQQKEFSEAILGSLPGIFYMLDLDGGFVRVNRKFSEVSGYSEEELLGKNALDFFEGEDVSLISSRIKEVFETGESWAEADFVTKSGKKIPYFFTGHVNFIDGKTHLVGLGTNISERRQLEQELVHQARTDMLTGLPNRRRFLELAEQELSRAKRYGGTLSALMIDLDNFKSINDSHGHQTGDMVLVKFAEICLQSMRSIDITGRIGGEEFAILLPETDEKHALEAAERLRIRISEESLDAEKGSPLKFSVSIGIATLGSFDDIDKLLGAADKALYEAKRSGRNRVVSVKP